MIADKSRDYYIGASDTKFIMMSFDTKTFQRFWEVKIGAWVDEVDNIYTRTGNRYEQKILDAIFVPYRNEQFIVGQLRVNLDGRTDEEVIEVKTTNKEYKMPKAHWQQVQVEMFASCMPKARIIAYRLEEDDYEYDNEIDIERISIFPVAYDESWVMNEYLPRLNHVIWCFNMVISPSNDGFEEWKGVKNGTT